MNKSELLLLLDDEDVQNVIRNINLPLKETNIVDNQNYMMIHKYDELEKIKAGLLSEIESLHEENGNLKKQYDELQTEHQQYKSIEREKHKWVELCHSLPTDIFDRISNIIAIEGDYDILMYSLVQLENLELLWDFMKEEIINDKIAHMETPLSLFKHGFDAYSCIDNRFQLQDGLFGQKYDGETMIPHSSGRASGNVGQVLLPGYVLTKSGKCRKKSVVVLE